MHFTSSYHGEIEVKFKPAEIIQNISNMKIYPKALGHVYDFSLIIKMRVVYVKAISLQVMEKNVLNKNRNGRNRIL